MPALRSVMPDLRSVMPDLLGHPEAGKRSEECIEKSK